MTATAEPSIAERLVGALSAAWAAIQERHSEVPDVVLALGSGTAGARGTTKLGHFAKGRWERVAPGSAGGEVDELFVGGEGLRRGAGDVLATLLHEAAHGLAAARGIQDTSRGARYHNRRFRALAEELGLEVDEDGTRGWSRTVLTPAAAREYAVVLEQLAGAITTVRRAESPRTRRRKSSGELIAAVCGCERVRRIRVARSTLGRAPITCELCREAFKPEDGPAAG